MCKTVGFLFIIAIALLLPQLSVAEEAPESPKPSVPAAKEEKDCLSYEPGVVTLKGTLHRPGSMWSLELNNPVCIEKRESDPVYYPPVDEVKNILFWKRKRDSLDSYIDKYQEFLNRDVVVTGTLHHKNTGSDAGSIMMMVSHIDVAKKDETNDRK